MTNTEASESIFWSKSHDKYGRSAQSLTVAGRTYAVAVRLPGGHPEGLPILVNLWLIPTYVGQVKVESEVKVTYHRTMQAAKKWAQAKVRELRLTPAVLENATDDQLLAAWTLAHQELSRALAAIDQLDRLAVEADSISRIAPSARVKMWRARVELVRAVYLSRVSVAV